jgi:hypothetical protein
MSSRLGSVLIHSRTLSSCAYAMYLLADDELTVLGSYWHHRVAVVEDREPCHASILVNAHTLSRRDSF